MGNSRNSNDFENKFEAVVFGVAVDYFVLVYCKSLFIILSK